MGLGVLFGLGGVSVCWVVALSCDGFFVVLVGVVNAGL